MSCTVETVNGCTKKLVFNLDNVDLSTEVESALAKKRSEANIKGFRKGKAPISMIKQLYGAQVENEALYQFISTQFFDALKEKELKAVGYPSFDNTSYKSEEKAVSFEATVEVFPEFSVGDYKGWSFEQDNPEINDEDLTTLEGRYLESKAEMVEVADEARTLENGLFAVMNFEGEKPDGERPENMKGSDYLLEIGSNSFIPGFEEGMVGMKKGEKKTLELTFPEDYHAEDLKGATVKFDVEVLEIKEKKTPELTDDMAKEFGFESVADFKEKNTAQLAIQKKRASLEKLHQDILDKLVNENSFDVPNTMVQQQETHLQKDFEQNLRSQGFNDDMVKDYFNKWQDDFHSKASFQVKSGLILDKLASDLGVEADDKDLENKFDQIAEEAGMTREEVDAQYKNNPNIVSNLKYAIREEKTFEVLKKDFTITVK